MVKIKVESSVIDSIEFVPRKRTSGNVHIIFKSGNEYCYYNAGWLLQELLKAESHGKYYNEFIKGQYVSERIV